MAQTTKPKAKKTSRTARLAKIRARADEIGRAIRIRKSRIAAGGGGAFTTVPIKRGECVGFYLGAAGKLKLINDVSAVAAPGSVLVLQFMDGSQSAAAKANPEALKAALTVEEATLELTKHGWEDLEFSSFGDEKLSFGRYPERFAPNAAFSFCVCKKGAR